MKTHDIDLATWTAHLMRNAGDETSDRMLRNAAGRVVGHHAAATMTMQEVCMTIAEQGWNWSVVLRINS